MYVRGESGPEIQRTARITGMDIPRRVDDCGAGDLRRRPWRTAATVAQPGGPRHSVSDILPRYPAFMAAELG
jgi:hypothetical protein